MAVGRGPAPAAAVLSPSRRSPAAGSRVSHRLRLSRRFRALTTAIGLSALGAAGCADRVVGQVELLTFDKDGRLFRYNRAEAPRAERAMIPGFGDPVRSNDDVVTVIVESAYIQNLPFRLTGSKDVIIFADVWENAAAGFNSPSTLTSIVYVGPNQKVPGRLNLRDMLAYGPTRYKGHPLRVRFTMMVLQKAAAGRQSSAIDVISSLAAMAAPQYSAASSEIAKLLQGILRAQPDIKFFDFDATFYSDQPEGLADVIPGEQTLAGPEAQGGTPSTTLRPSPGLDGVHWLRYGRYALVETESYDRTTSTVDLQPSDVRSDDARLWTSGAPLATSYIVFRVLPGQRSESNEVLRAASDANARLLESLRRSDAEIAAAVKDIQASAKSLQDQVVRSRAESIAYTAFRDAEARQQTDCEAIARRFDARWSDESLNIPDADKIGASVRKRWKDKCEVAHPPGGKSAAPGGSRAWLDAEGNRTALAGELTGKAVTAEGLTFRVEPGAAVRQSAAGKAFDTVEVSLAVSPAPTRAAVSRSAVEAGIAKLANAFVENQSNDQGPIKRVSIRNQDAEPLRRAWRP